MEIGTFTLRVTPIVKETFSTTLLLRNIGVRGGHRQNPSRQDPVPPNPIITTAVPGVVFEKPLAGIKPFVVSFVTVALRLPLLNEGITLRGPLDSNVRPTLLLAKIPLQGIRLLLPFGTARL